VSGHPPVDRSADPSARHPSGPPVRPSAQPPDLIGVALGSLASGAAAGAALVAVALVLLRHRLADLLPLIPFGGIVVAATVAWLLAAPIADWWRRGVTAALAVFGAMMLAALTAPADMVGGHWALGAFALVLAAAALAAARYARRSRSHAR
jgi:hypothetical protein